jgi:hypothetical protein
MNGPPLWNLAGLIRVLGGGTQRQAVRPLLAALGLAAEPPPGRPALAA